MLPREFTVDTKTISIQQNLDYGHAGSVWDAALVWVHYLSKNYTKLSSNKIFNDKIILELGAGTGVSGLLLAAGFSPRQVILTDMPENLKLINDNIELNASQIPSDVKVNTVSFLWGKDLYNISDQALQKEIIIPTGCEQPQLDIVLGSDLMYDDANTVKLLETIEELSQTIGKSALFIIVYCIRKESERTFVKILEEKYDSEYVQQSEFDPTYRDEDIGIIQFRRKESK